jgi:putative salt-induced outer membrane protein YdiY
MRNVCKITALFTVLLISSWLPVYGDEIRLKNGDRITGDILRMENDALVMKTAYAGEIKVAWQEIQCIVSDKETTLVMKDKEVFVGLLTCPEGGKVQVSSKAAGETAPIPLSQVQTLNPPPPPPGVTYKANINAGAGKTTGNTDTMNANASAGFQARSKRQRFTLGAKYNYGENDGVIDTRNSTGTIKYDFFVTEKVYSYANALFQKDEFQDLDLRSTLGVGVGYQFFDSEPISLFVETGISYFSEDFNEAEDQQYASARWAVGLDYEIIPKRLKFFHSHEGYYSLEKSGAYYIRSQQGFKVPLVEKLYANFELDYDYNSKPARGIEKGDSTYIFGLGYESNF